MTDCVNTTKISRRSILDGLAPATSTRALPASPLAKQMSPNLVEVLHEIEEYYRDRPVEDILALRAWMIATFPHLRP